MACRNVRDRLPAVLRLLQDISLENNSGDRKVEAKGLLAQIDFQFIALLVIFCKVLGDITILSDMLQSSNLDLSKAVDLVGSLTDTLKSYRSEACFGELLRDTQELVERCKISTLPLSKRQPKASSRFLDSLVMTTVGQRHSDQSNEDFNRGVFYQILDCLTAELERRFSQKNCEIMLGVQSLVPKSPLFLKEETLYAFGQTFESDLEDLKHEVHQTRRLLLRRENGGLERPSTLLDLVVFLEPYKEFFHELFRLCKISVVIPVSTASCERSFSALKLIKNHLRTTMADDRLSHLGILSVESRRAHTLNMDDFVKHFASSHQNRRIMLS
ncbi:uncharacterized protein LOC116720753 [Xiphophorus hellerii]|uniref:uncharacterized protein LOC116720753 n=1 Tax=Xiphophorus hellerii TaxID=8084 RepID=UPI0013B3A7C5|nr:uncharacterized protein LOC116720753 [Xiphophorus hellerii]